MFSVKLASPAWALAAAAAAAEQDEFTDEDSDLGSEEEEDSYDHVSLGKIPRKFCIFGLDIPSTWVCVFACIALQCTTELLSRLIPKDSM